MSTIDPAARGSHPTRGAGPPPSPRRRDESGPVPARAEESLPPQGPAETRDITAEVLREVADRALERPPRDVIKLAASAAKYMLTSLEPALSLAKDIRRQTASDHAIVAIEAVGGVGRDETFAAVSSGTGPMFVSPDTGPADEAVG
jgi:hypothetical protein